MKTASDWVTAWNEGHIEGRYMQDKLEEVIRETWNEALLQAGRYYSEADCGKPEVYQHQFASLRIPEKPEGK